MAEPKTLQTKYGPVEVRGSWLRWPERGTAWPNPLDPNDVQWRLRYAQGSVTKADMMFAASVLSAYRSLHTRPIESAIADLRRMRAALKTEGDSHE